MSKKSCIHHLGDTLRWYIAGKVLWERMPGHGLNMEEWKSEPSKINHQEQNMVPPSRSLWPANIYASSLTNFHNVQAPVKLKSCSDKKYHGQRAHSNYFQNENPKSFHFLRFMVAITRQASCWLHRCFSRIQVLSFHYYYYFLIRWRGYPGPSSFRVMSSVNY